MNAFGTADAISGSSPLARGLLTVNWVTVMGSRIIPARAGFTGCASTTTTSDPDHPRSRGVYHDPLPGWACDAGSSPLARGLPAEGRCVPLRGRIIPARAGFTPGSTRTRRFSPDHPRSRGVYPGFYENEEVLAGSSPLARGLQPPTQPWCSPVRIIPARAGFTYVLEITLRGIEDHPRSRGVYRE